TLLGLDKNSKQKINSPYPDIVLSSTRRTAPVARYIKKNSPKTKLTQLIHIGKTGITDFEKIFVPEHDMHKHRSPNIVYTTGAPHFITQEKLDKAKTTWDKQFSHLPHPITALIIGGAIKNSPFSLENATNLALAVKKYKEQTKGSLLITTSRRTGKLAEEQIMKHLSSIPNFNYLWGATGDNPYLGFLACADDLIVTGDSVSMCCEATATKKPLRIFTGSNWLTKKHIRFINSLYNKQYATELTSENNISFTPSTSTLNTAQEIANTISEL
ncbi:MAG: mitochondrial fission ELM1 family protein, partial [Alphaproteobacteria bacterium]|nr:mitochondrial fission ELM1 family protein [Alphaproteobacteria bacterium]